MATFTFLHLSIRAQGADWSAFNTERQTVSGQITLSLEALSGDARPIVFRAMGAWVASLLGMPTVNYENSADLTTTAAAATAGCGLYELADDGPPEPYDLATRGLQAELDAASSKIWLRNPAKPERKLVLREADSSNANFTDLMASAFAPLDDPHRRLIFASTMELLADLFRWKIDNITSDSPNCIICCLATRPNAPAE